MSKHDWIKKHQQSWMNQTPMFWILTWQQLSWWIIQNPLSSKPIILPGYIPFVTGFLSPRWWVRYPPISYARNQGVSGLSMMISWFSRWNFPKWTPINHWWTIGPKACWSCGYHHALWTWSINHFYQPGFNLISFINFMNGKSRVLSTWSAIEKTRQNQGLTTFDDVFMMYDFIFIWVFLTTGDPLTSSTINHLKS